MSAQNWGDAHVQRVIQSLEADDLHKSQAHRDFQGQWLDIYRPWIDAQRMYVKLTMGPNETVLIMSFCRDREVH